MAWTAPMTATANTAFTAAQWNTYVRDNLNETAVAKATAEGGYFVGAGVNQLVERFWTTDTVIGSGSTSSTSYANLAGSFGPSVTVDTSSRALVILSARMRNNTTSEYAAMSFEVSGDSTISPTGDNGLIYEAAVGGVDLQVSSFIPIDNLTPGSNTFTCKYSVSAGTGTWQRRSITVLPF